MSLLKALILPPGSLILLLGVGLLLARRRRRAGVAVAIAATLLLYAAATPLLGSHGLYWLAAGYGPPDAGGGEGAIVVLGADFQATPDGDAPGELTLQRLWRAARLHRETGLPVLVTAGEMDHLDEPAAATMARVLEQDFGVPVRWRETRAANTWENAEFSAALLAEQGIAPVFLVTHGWHLPRATMSFRAHKLIATPTPVYNAERPGFRLTDLVPSATALHATYFAGHEVFGWFWYRVVRRQ